MAEYKLALEKRTLTGKKLKTLRADGFIPSVIYGKKEPILAASLYNPTEKIARAAGHHSPISLDIDGKTQLAIIKNVSVDPTSRRIINIEFQAVSASSVVEATAPIVLVNFETSEAHKTHLAYLQVVEEIGIKAKPNDLPKELSIDASRLASIEDKITVADITLPKNVEFANKDLSEDTIIANVYDPVAEAAAREAEEEAPSEEESQESEENTEEKPAEEN